MTRQIILRTSLVLVTLAVIGWLALDLIRSKSVTPTQGSVPSADITGVVSQPGGPEPVSQTPQSAGSSLESIAATNKLFQTAEFFWKQPVAEDVFARFHDWAERYDSASDTEKALMESEGTALATERRAALAELIQSDPERALQLAVPLAVRTALPQSVQTLLEGRLDGRGRLAVMASLGEASATEDATRTWRMAEMNGRELKAFVYGWRLGEPTRDNIPLNGIAVDDVFAVNENAVRILESIEAADAFARNADPICSVSSEPADVNSQQIAAMVAEQPVFFCLPSHAEQLNDNLIAAENGPPGPEGGDDPQASAYTEGEKKVILIRVDFDDLPGASFSDSSAVNLINGLNNFYTDMSYGRASFALEGSGSDYTPVFRMPQTAAYYGTNDYYNQLRTAARSAATAAGYVMANYEFDVICIGAVPGWSWGGLGYVGSPGSWIRNTSSTGVTAHELGHNFGLNHAGFWNTTNQSVVGAGANIEYGDSFDTMGSASAGNNHFSARYKQYLGWIKSGEFLTVTNNGTYRIVAHDQTNAFGVRGLRIPRNTSTNYWVEFRQKFTSNKWLMSGAGLRWAQNGNQKSLLLDTTPGTSEAKNDSAIVIGRTFSDTAAGIHITPVRKGGTFPESLDVVVNLGTFPANYPPTLTMTASATNVSTGNPVQFTAVANDPNGDAMAYYWDFGDGNFGTNGSTASKSWSSAGEYVVRCDVTDMKGGVGSKYVIVRVGSPSVYRISGRVATTNSPVQGARVYVSTTRMAWTDDLGNYTITGLPAGSYTVNAMLENFTFANSGFSNPVSVGSSSPQVTGVNFIASSGVFTKPAITAQPTNRTVAAGASATFAVTSTGTGPLYYQWRFNGNPIPGATGVSCTITNCQAGNVGSYSVIVSNIMGNAVSAGASLSINSAPVITGQPEDQQVAVGSDATFDVSAVGTGPMSYRWFYDDVEIPGATASIYTHTNSQAGDTGHFTVAVSNILGVATSAPAILQVSVPPVISFIEIQTNGFALTLTGSAGDQYTIEASSNFTNWNSLATLTNETGQVQFLDTQTSNILNRFYRARVE